MKNKFSMLLLLGILSVTTAWSQQQSVSGQNLPPAVVQSLQRNFNGYTLGQVVRVDRRGAGTGFRVRVQKSGATWEVELDTRGQVRERVVVVEQRRDEDRDEDHHEHKHKHKHKHKHDCDHGKREHHCREHHHCEHDDDDCDHNDD